MCHYVEINKHFSVCIVKKEQKQRGQEKIRVCVDCVCNVCSRKTCNLNKYSVFGIEIKYSSSEGIFRVWTPSIYLIMASKLTTLTVDDVYI